MSKMCPLRTGCGDRVAGEPLAFGLEADFSDCFYDNVNPQLGSWFGVDLKRSAKEWVDLGLERRPVSSDESHSFYVPEDHVQLHPVFEGLCTGWSWALFLANGAVAFPVIGRIEKPLSEIRDRLPP